MTGYPQGVLGGAGICTFGTTTVTNSTISGNRTTFCCGGGVYNSGALTVTNSSISGRLGIPRRRHIQHPRRLTVTNSTVSGNTRGRGIDNYGGTVTVLNSTISGNTDGGISVTGC